MLTIQEMNVPIVSHQLPSPSKPSFLSRTCRYIRQKLIPKDLGRRAVVQHVLGDAVNNVGVMIAALVMMLVKSKYRFYADPAMSVLIAMGLFS